MNEIIVQGAHGKLYELPETVEPTEAVTVVAYWKDGKATIVKRELSLRNELLESVRFIPRQGKGRVLTLSLPKHRPSVVTK